MFSEMLQLAAMNAPLPSVIVSTGFLSSYNLMGKHTKGMIGKFNINSRINRCYYKDRKIYCFDHKVFS